MDETTNKGAGIVLLTQLIMFGILKPLSHDGTQGDLKHLELEDGWEKRTMMFTMARIKSFDDLLSSSRASTTDECFRMCLNFVTMMTTLNIW